MTDKGDDLDVDAILKLFQETLSDEGRDPNEGLRERKKRQVRQRISNVATAMFLTHGFDNVTVAEIAAASEVSEQTVFNYFTTKESMFFDRSEPMITALADAVRERNTASLIEVVVQSISSEIHPGRWDALDDAAQLHLIRLFCDVATKSPTAGRDGEFAVPGHTLELTVILVADAEQRLVGSLSAVWRELVRLRPDIRYLAAQEDRIRREKARRGGQKYDW